MLTAVKMQEICGCEGTTQMGSGVFEPGHNEMHMAMQHRSLCQQSRDLS